MSDARDAALAGQGDHQAFERLYRRYESRIYSLCTRLSGNPSKGEELLEEVFVRAWAELPTVGPQRGFAAWLRRLASDVSVAENTGDVQTTSVDGLDLSDAIAALPGDARTIIVLRDVEGFSYDEIAEILGITPGATKARLHRARVLLRKALAQ